MPYRICLGPPDGTPCPNLTTGRPRCPDCQRQYNQAREARRGNSTQRGYDSRHRRNRAALIEAHEATYGPLTHCPTCGAPLSPTNPITAQHETPLVEGGGDASALCCRVCNSGDGARVGNARRHRDTQG